MIECEKTANIGCKEKITDCVTGSVKSCCKGYDETCYVLWSKFVAFSNVGNTAGAKKAYQMLEERA